MDEIYLFGFSIEKEGSKKFFPYDTIARNIYNIENHAVGRLKLYAGSGGWA